MSILESQKKDEYFNIPDSIMLKLEAKYHNKKSHPINLIKERIYQFFDKYCSDNNTQPFEKFDELSPICTTTNNFDLLRIPETHPSRSKSDTYYVNKSTVLRTHTSAHQNELLSSGKTKFLVAGDVYRKDEVNATHYPVFHQMEGVCILDDTQDPETELKNVMSKLVEYLFPEREYRFNKDYFPFTDPSLRQKLNLKTNGQILGSGVVHEDILKHNNITKKAYAFGLGLDRYAMILFGIPDIRLLWSNDVKFLDQFKLDDISKIKYKAYSVVPSRTKDLSMWLDDNTEIIDNNWTKINDFYEYVREICGNDIENVYITDKFTNKTGRVANVFRFVFSSTDSTLTDPAIFNKICDNSMSVMRESVGKKFKVTLR